MNLKNIVYISMEYMIQIDFFKYVEYEYGRYYVPYYVRCTY